MRKLAALTVFLALAIMFAEPIHYAMTTDEKEIAEEYWRKFRESRTQSPHAPEPIAAIQEQRNEEARKCVGYWSRAKDMAWTYHYYGYLRMASDFPRADDAADLRQMSEAFRQTLRYRPRYEDAVEAGAAARGFAQGVMDACFEKGATNFLD